MIIVNSISKRMGLKKLRVQGVEFDNPRTPNPGTLFDALRGGWDKIQEAINTCSEEEKKELRDYFNAIIDEIEIGTALFGSEGEQASIDDYQLMFEELYSHEIKEAYFKALIESELIELPERFKEYAEEHLKQK